MILKEFKLKHMKRFTIVFIAVVSILLANAQTKLDYSISVIYNRSSQTNYNPQLPDDGTFQWNALNTFGIGVNIGKPLSDRVYWTNRLLCQQKGYSQEAQTADFIDGIPGPLSYHKLQDRFGYLTIESNIGYHIIKFKSLKLTPLIGFNINYLLSKSIESEGVYPINSCYPIDEYNGNWKKINVGYNVGISCAIQKKVNLGFEFQRSITPLLKTNDLTVKDWTWSVRLDFLLSE